MMDTTDETVNSAVYRVSVRLPHFWPGQPAVCFGQAESQFELTAITRQRTKFNYVVSQLNQQQAAEVEDIISPPELEPYDRLKAELVRRLSTSREQRVRQLLNEEMGDRKQQFLRHLKSLAPDVHDYFLRTIWASRLPPHVQAILAGKTEGSLDSTSRLADNLRCYSPAYHSQYLPFDTRQPSRTIRADRGALTPGCFTAGLTNRLSQSRARHRPHSRDRFSSTTDNTVQPHDICWYHWKFGDGARKCSSPCSHQQRFSHQQWDFRQQRDPNSSSTSDNRETPNSRKTPPADVNGG